MVVFRVGPVVDARTLRAYLRGLVAVNAAWNPPVPLYRSGVRYRREAPGREVWLSNRELYRARAGDCEDLCCARVAELRRRGIAARAEPRRTRIGWHIVVLWPDGRVEDPSKRLGM